MSFFENVSAFLLQVSGISSNYFLFSLLLSVLVAGLARGFSGFGAALIFIPLASAIIGPKMASPVLLVIDCVAAAGLLPAAARAADRRDVSFMAAGAAIGVPLGAWALLHTNPLAVRWIISITAGLFLILLMSGWRYKGNPSPPLGAAVGLIAGVFSGAAQLGGPPVVAYWLGGRNSAERVRANIVFYFAISSIFSIISYLYAGLFMRQIFILSLVCGPLYAFGLFLGARSFGLASEAVFRRICYGLIGLAAIFSLPLLDPFLR